MARSIDETRRDFLIRLAKAAAFVPPAIASFDVRGASAQGKVTTPTSTPTTGGKGASGLGVTVGSLSPTANVREGTQFRLTEPDAPAPWSPERPSAPPPWSRPPPTQTGR